MKRKLLIAFAVVLLVTAAAAAAALRALNPANGPPLCAELYAETADPVYLTMSAPGCWWRHRQMRDAIEAARQVRADVILKAQQQQNDAEKALLAQTKSTICPLVSDIAAQPVDLHIRASSERSVDVDLVALEGHSPVYSIEVRCLDCADMMGSYIDLTGARFCTYGGKGGSTCKQMNAFKTLAHVHREGTPESVAAGFGCPPTTH